jgi:hypothetical protein
MAGTGKTRLLASAPSPVIISAEKGNLSLRNFTLPVWEVQSLKDLTEAYDFLSKSKDANQFATIGIDSVSEVAEVLLAEEKNKTKDGRKAYGEMQDKLVPMFRDFRDIVGKNVVFLAKQEFTTDGATGAKANGPSFPGTKLSQQVPYLVDELWQLVKVENADKSFGWWLRTSPSLQDQAKDRSGALDLWENADPATGGGLDVIFKKMIG